MCSDNGVVDWYYISMRLWLPTSALGSCDVCVVWCDVWVYVGGHGGVFLKDIQFYFTLPCSPYTLSTWSAEEGLLHLQTVCLPKLYTSHVFTPLQKYKYNCNPPVVESCLLPKTMFSVWEWAKSSLPPIPIFTPKSHAWCIYEIN